jgi:hypothetical protein
MEIILQRIQYQRMEGAYFCASSDIHYVFAWGQQDRITIINFHKSVCVYHLPWICEKFAAAFWKRADIEYMTLTDAILTGSYWWSKTKGIPPRTKLVYNGTLVNYIGFAARGSATSEAKWIIVQFSYDANDLVTDIKISADNVVMDNYASLTYS